MTENTYILSVRADGRVILDYEAQGEVLETVQAVDRASALDKIKTHILYLCGFGWIVDNSEAPL